MRFYIVLAVVLAAALAKNDCECDIECSTSSTSISDTYSARINKTCSACSFNTCSNYATEICGKEGLVPWLSPYDSVSGYDCPKALGLAIGAIVGISIAVLVAVICVPVCVCFLCGMACFAGSRQHTTAYVAVPTGTVSYQQAPAGYAQPPPKGGSYA
eukprot:m.15481 g.15481  ORF g.15481 m.15481 type:complete len:158 (-) comp10470_c0_seq1:96-569(-)